MNRDTNLSNINVPGGNPCGQGENMQTPHKMAPPGEATVIITTPPCRPWSKNKQYNMYQWRITSLWHFIQMLHILYRLTHTNRGLWSFPPLSVASMDEGKENEWRTLLHEEKHVFPSTNRKDFLFMTSLEHISTACTHTQTQIHKSATP